MMAKFASISAIACTMAMACSQGAAAPSHPNELQITLLRNGDIKVDGQPADIEKIRTELDRMKTVSGGQAAYYREGGNAAPSPGLQMKVVAILGAINDAGLPIRMSSEPDFSTSIDDQGRVVPHD